MTNTNITGYVSYTDAFGTTHTVSHKFPDNGTHEAVRNCAKWVLEQMNEIALSKNVDEIEGEWVTDSGVGCTYELNIGL